MHDTGDLEHRKQTNSSGVELSIQSESSVDAGVIVRPDSWTVSSVHAALFEAADVKKALLESIRKIATGRTPREFEDYLTEIGVDALKGDYRERCLSVAEGDFTSFLYLPC